MWRPAHGGRRRKGTNLFREAGCGAHRGRRRDATEHRWSEHQSSGYIVDDAPPLRRGSTPEPSRGTMGSPPLLRSLPAPALGEHRHGAKAYPAATAGASSATTTRRFAQPRVCARARSGSRDAADLQAGVCAEHSWRLAAQKLAPRTDKKGGHAAVRVPPVINEPWVNRPAMPSRICGDLNCALRLARRSISSGQRCQYPPRKIGGSTWPASSRCPFAWGQTQSAFGPFARA